MKLTLMRSTVVAIGLVSGTSLFVMPAEAQSEYGNSGQQVEEAADKGKSKAKEAKAKIDKKSKEMRQRSEDAGDERKRAEEQGKNVERAQEEKANGGNRDNENRKAEPGTKGSETGQAKKQEKSKAWWNFWSE